MAGRHVRAPMLTAGAPPPQLAPRPALAARGRTRRLLQASPFLSVQDAGAREASRQIRWAEW
eukprot:scaffold1206_cov388-Prasinococcus_capsulatus_cf.AAC.45